MCVRRLGGVVLTLCVLTSYDCLVSEHAVHHDHSFSYSHFPKYRFLSYDSKLAIFLKCDVYVTE